MTACLSPRERLLMSFSPDLVAALEELVAERVVEEVERPLHSRDWLTLQEAGERLGVSADAIRMQANRGRLDDRHLGGRRYVSAASVERLR